MDLCYRCRFCFAWVVPFCEGVQLCACGVQWGCESGKWSSVSKEECEERLAHKADL